MAVFRDKSSDRAHAGVLVLKIAAALHVAFQRGSRFCQYYLWSFAYFGVFIIGKDYLEKAVSGGKGVVRPPALR